MTYKKKFIGGWGRKLTEIPLGQGWAWSPALQLGAELACMHERVPWHWVQDQQVGAFSVPLLCPVWAGAGPSRTF